MTYFSAESCTVQVIQNGLCTKTNDIICTEVPVAIVYNGISHVVLMATPDNIAELVLGFSLSEGIIEHPTQIYAIDICEQANGIIANVDLAAVAFVQLKDRRRQMSGRTGCGLCGIDSLEAVQHELSPVVRQQSINAAAIERVLNEMSQHQILRAQTGSVHGVAWANLHGDIVMMREDVGRHNALDKIIGWGLHAKVDWREGFVVLSSRASFEMVMKSAITGIGCIVAVSAPTTYAVDLAKKANITLVGFARHNRQVIYTHPQFFHL